MTSEVLSSYNVLQNELDHAKTVLKDLDENIKKLLGRDPSDSNARNNKRSVSSNVQSTDDFRNKHNDNFSGRFNESNNRQSENVFSRQRNRNQGYNDVDEPIIKKRAMDSSVFKRLDRPRPSDDDDMPTKPQMFSRVIVTPREVPSRLDALKAQGRDEKSKERNRRMFGALLGTLQKFRQEETKLKNKEEKRALVEKKLEEQEIMEKAKVKKERHELFLGRKRKQQEIRLIEQKMIRIKEHTLWEQRHKPLVNFIQTTAKPQIYYLPKKMTPQTTEKLTESRKAVEKLMEEKKQQLQQELDALVSRFQKGEYKEADGEHDENDGNDDEMEIEAEVHEKDATVLEEDVEEVAVKQEDTSKEENNLENETVQIKQDSKIDDCKIKETNEAVDDNLANQSTMETDEAKDESQQS